MRNPFIIGQRVYLRGLEREDLKSNYFQWANDPEVTYYLEMGWKPNNYDLLEEEYFRTIRSQNDIVFVIVDKETDRLIGSCGLYSINFIARKAEYRIIIGEKDYWDKGIGTEVTKLVIAYAFEKLNLNKVWLGVNAENIRAIKCYEKAGFKREGVLRQEIFRNNRYYDAIRMSILREEYEKSKKIG
jgi:RimJ/RimL family protein N-acetyltransferase